MTRPALAWHFVGPKLRDGRPVPANDDTLMHLGDLELCKSGLHASKRLIDALQYAPGSTICRVRMGGKIIQDGNKLVATERTILWRVDGETLLRDFARACALDVIHLWYAHDIVVQYLKTGDETIREAARGVSWGAAWEAGRNNAWIAAQGAAYDAAWDLGSDGEWAAVRDKQNKRLVRMVLAERKRQINKEGVK
jgi:hypothetical protein